MTLRNSRHEKFAQLVAAGRSQSDAYREVYPKSRRWKDETIHPWASKLAYKVSTRLAELKEAGASNAVMTKNEACAYLTKVVRSADGDGGGIGGRIAAAGRWRRCWDGMHRKDRSICWSRYRPMKK
jgi:hypothetical protein